MTSHCRGEKRITSAPNRAMSNRDAAVAISSIAQQARPIGIGQSEFLRTQLKAASSRVKMTLPSILESYALEWLSGMAKVSSATYACNIHKPQIPSPKLQANPKFQSSKARGQIDLDD